MKKTYTLLALVLCTSISHSHAQNRDALPPFDKENDLLIAQFDNRPDTDDVHAQAAFGSILAHPNYKDINVYGVLYAYGNQTGRIWDSNVLMEMILGPEDDDTWTDALREDGLDKWNLSVQRIADQAEVILDSGGRVWVQEAGQSNITSAWVNELIVRGTLTPGQGSYNGNGGSPIVVVQHSDWNEGKSRVETGEDDPDLSFVGGTDSSAILDYLKLHTNYFKIDDGNDDGNATPKYKNLDTEWIERASTELNPNALTRAYWATADSIVGGKGSNRAIKNGGVDYSDCVENWWILELGTMGDSVPAFWADFIEYVPNPPLYSEDFLESESFRDMTRVEGVAWTLDGWAGQHTVKEATSTSKATHKNLNLAIVDNAELQLGYSVSLSATEVGDIETRMRIKVRRPSDGKTKWLNSGWGDLSGLEYDPYNYDEYSDTVTVPAEYTELIIVRLQFRNSAAGSPAQVAYVDDIFVTQ
ncbi:MAG: hypothetical protein ACPGN3_06095 [Opitutales bacterium]